MATGAETGQATPITVAYGDGIGPEIMEATLRIIEAAGARIAPERIEIGEAVYERGLSAGIEPSAWESLRRTRVFLKAPITTPQGGGFKSLNVTVRKTLGLYANVRPCVAYHPFVDTKHPGMDVVIVRENEEDLYAGIEHRQTDQVMQCLKLITRPGTEKIVRYAFEYARLHGRRKVTCFTKDNIMKLTDGLFHKVFDEVAAEYPDIENEHWIVDIGAAKLADTPDAFDVIVMPNLYGDVLSDVAAQIAGSVGLAGSANIGEHAAMFEAIHGSAPRRAGQDLANPSGLFLAAVMMLVHIGQPDVATRAHNAWLRTIEDGIHTYDIFEEGVSREKVGTKAFADAVIARLGQEPQQLTPVAYTATEGGVPAWQPGPRSVKAMVGVDVFVDSIDHSPSSLAEALQAATPEGLALQMITNRGVKVWPDGLPETFCTDHWRCRFQAADGGPITHQQIVDLLQRVGAAGIDFIKTESLCTFDGEPGFSLGQGQ
ncbi:MAG: NADP-dependent isocitrate dehydrogenase [Dehalococcoidia bacterium]|nr:NADP-dependent isocitrate dehydrogenase [Dehalococcoidia bacterium]MCB9483683.1 NADP-dependent isocitrate dehydrogenase [Dehalococcoidia bacterium]MCB9491115.1 NADP-dependent isocitrate dehydrogenase [Dehalococcoidia bacterium]